MESAQDIAPFLCGTFRFHQIGKSETPQSIDEKDLSFIGLPRDQMKTPLKDWDLPNQGNLEPQIPETAPPIVRRKRVVRGPEEFKPELDLETSSNKKAKKHKRKSKDDSSGHSSVIDLHITVTNDTKLPSNENQSNQTPNIQPTSASTGDSENVKISIENPNNEIVGEIRSCLPGSSESTTQPPEEPKPRSFQPEKIELLALFQTLFATPSVSATSFIDKERKFHFPPAIFPLFSAILTSHVFDNGLYKPDEITTFVKFFTESIEKSKLLEKSTQQEKLFTYILLVVLVQKENLDRNLYTDFINGLMIFIQTSIDAIIRPSLLQFEGIANRFATAKFDNIFLLSDAKQLLHGIKGALKLPDPIVEYIANYFLSIAEVKLINKLIENPSRFNFTNAMLWNSFVNAFISDERIELPLLREGVCAFMMIHNIASTPKMKNEICPNLSPSLLLYIMKNFNPDDVMPKRVSYDSFVKEFKLGENDATPEKIEEPKLKMISLDDLKDLMLDNWREKKVDIQMGQSFPFLNAYTSE
ncbi:hypothetical protein GPJ56_009037 [Histomonas meleagridis]|uniref:uncharacterized protein n=1 Tax=Histomonas meleagridis TaxID=135588 RepID=UPI00355A4510|nr:hypothetical protein GPJ56_009037 [Histomonas meleagridis]KAH0799308.1 hypothetical protein GO595_008105 [Histomonas meleagridis]